ncbi:MAG: methylmalonyl-CoA epimerase [Ardenticatenales bacterium]|nr:methylmalonyl-CoA epimerase [Ardenticatenales bacterium]
MPNPNRPLRIHHIAIAVPDAAAALTFWRDALGLEVGAVHDEPAQGVAVTFLPVGEGAIELVEPTDAASGIARFVASRGPGMHHVCLEVDDLDAAVVHLKGRGVRLITEAPVSNSSGRRLIFVHPSATGGVLVELYDSLGADASKRP